MALEFSWGKSLPDQFFEIVQQETEKLIDGPIEAILGTKLKLPEEITIHRKKKALLIHETWRKKLDNFLMDSNEEDIEPFIKTVHLLMTLAIPSGNEQLARKLSVWGKKIGEMAEGLEKYFEAGGRVYDHRKSKSGDSSRSDEEN
jgi:hypothetical protein